MKNTLILISILLMTSVYGQDKQSLSDLLWNNVDSCYSLFEDMDGDGIIDFDKVDDSKNGYLKVSGVYPTCGCFCSTTVGAYKNSNGDYIILQSNVESCSWKKEIVSNKKLKDILPNGFGIESFTSKPLNYNLGNPIFFLDFEIPRKGTDTKVILKLIPFGLYAEGSEMTCYSYKENHPNSKDLYEIKEMIQKFNHTKTITKILENRFDEISEEDRLIISKYIKKNNSFKSFETIQEQLKKLKDIYNVYNELEIRSLTLGWDKHHSKFYIKSKNEKSSSISFKEFLIENQYWSPLC